jgi:uncharacterized protein YqcC (DUF446 family)
MQMSAGRHASILAQLDEIEKELKTIGYWSADCSDPHAGLAPNEQRSALNASSFEAWLQLVFLPNARNAVASDALPPKSQVGLMALRRYDHHSFVPEAQRLIRLLNDFDQLVEAAAAEKST